MSMNARKPFLPDANCSASAGLQPPAARARPWKVIAQEVSGEQDPAKLTKLVDELNQALDEQLVGGSSATISPHDQVNEKGDGSVSLEKH
jgi:hypothetical protein